MSQRRSYSGAPAHWPRDSPYIIDSGRSAIQEARKEVRKLQEMILQQACRPDPSQGPVMKLAYQELKAKKKRLVQMELKYAMEGSTHETD